MNRSCTSTRMMKKTMMHKVINNSLPLYKTTGMASVMPVAVYLHAKDESKSNAQVH